MKILVTGNCQTGGVGASLAALFPKALVEMQIIPNFHSDSEKEIFADQKLKETDFWFTIRDPGVSELAKNSSIKVIQIPDIFFNAFHPDLTYVRHKKIQKYTSIHYNSAIIAWAYLNKISVERTLSLFTADNFAALDYFNFWDGAVQHLRNNMQFADVNFDRFFLKIKRQGCFMHSVNHPKAFVVSEMSRLLAQKIDPSDFVMNAEIGINDGLMSAGWPIYPEIGDYYSVPSNGYRWRLNNHYFSSLEDYVRFCFASYKEEGFEPDDIQIIGRRMDAYDNALGS